MCARVLDGIMSKMGMHFLEPHVEMVPITKVRIKSENIKTMKEGTMMHNSADSDIARVMRMSMLNNDKYIKLNHCMKKTPAASMDQAEKVRKYMILMFSAVEVNEEKFSQMLNPTLKFGENTKTIGQT